MGPGIVNSNECSLKRRFLKKKRKLTKKNKRVRAFTAQLGGYSGDRAHVQVSGGGLAGGAEGAVSFFVDISGWFS